MKRTLVNVSDIMQLKEDSAIPYANRVESYGIKIRWIHGQCFEIRLPDGKYLITDPWFEDIKGEKTYISADELEGCDYITINHAHFDHFQGVPEIFKKFKPTIICDGMYARELSQVYKIDAGYFFPVVAGQSYQLDSFRLETTHGMHNFLVGSFSDIDDTAGQDAKRGIHGFSRLSSYGCLFNTNFMFILPNNLRIGFAAGIDNENQQEAWRHKGPNILMHQRMCFTSVDEYVEEIEMLKGQIVIPMHHDASYPYNADMNLFAEEVNKKLIERGSTARCLNPKRGQWYSISTGMVAVD